MIKVPKKAIFDFLPRKSPKIPPPVTQNPNENPANYYSPLPPINPIFVLSSLWIPLIFAGRFLSLQETLCK